jgi:hypothetical protein
MSDSPTQQQTTWRKHATNLALIVLAIVALYWRVFFLGETIIDVNTLNNQLPWGVSATGDENYPYNRRDPTDMYLTREYFIVNAYREGELPLWNPYTMAGHPIYADGVTRIFSPFLLVYTFLDLPLGYSVARIVEVLLGAIFMYLFLVVIGVSARAALLGALVFELSAHSLFHLTGLGWWGGLLWLPLIFLFVDRSITRNSFTQAILAGVFIALQFFCAYMPNQIYYVGAVVLYYLIFGLRVKNIVNRCNAKKLTTIRLFAMMAVSLTVGLALSASQWIPVMELLGFSNRRVVPTEAGFIYLPPWYLVTLIFPDLFGTAYDPKMVTLFTALNVSHDHSLYVSIAALLPLGFLLYSQRGGLKETFRKLRLLVNRNRPPENGSQQNNIGTPDKNPVRLAASTDRPPAEPGIPDSQGSSRAALNQHRIAFFIFFFIFALVVMMAAPLYVYLTQFIPVLRSIRVIVRAGVMFIFAASVLVGFGADGLLKASADEGKHFNRYVERFLLTVFALVAAAATASFLIKISGFIDGASGEYIAGSGRLAYLRNVTAAMSAQFTQPGASLILPLVFLLAVYKLWQLVLKNRISRKLFFALLVVVLITDLYVNSRQYDKTHDRKQVFPATQITDTLKGLGPGRVLVAPSGIETNRKARNNAQEAKIIAPPNTLLPYKIPTVTGKDQLFPKAYREFCSLIEPQKNLSHVVFEQAESRFFDLLNVKYLLTHEAAEVSSSYELLLKAEKVALYENRNAMPRAFFVNRVIQVAEAEEALKALRESGFDPKTTAVIEGKGIDLNFAATRNSRTPSSARIVEDQRNLVVIETESEEAGWLILSDNHYPGWQAAIDGRPTEIFRANHTMRAVEVPAGSHMLSFRFAPKAFHRSLYVSLASAILIFAVLVFLQIKGRAKV